MKRGKTTQTEAKAGRGQSPRRPRLPKPREGEAGQLVRSGVRRACCRVFAKAGVECRIHDLRHAHPTQMLKAGVLPGVVKERWRARPAIEDGPESGSV